MPKLKRGASKVKSTKKKQETKSKFFKSLDRFKKSRKLMNKKA